MLAVACHMAYNSHHVMQRPRSQLDLGFDGRGAVIVDRYRYKLWRSWGDTKQRCAWVMLNPSKADGIDDDPTLRRCIGFSTRWGFGALDVVNLYGFISTDPKDLWLVDDPIGPDNDSHLVEVIRAASRVVLAWGVNAKKKDRVEHVIGLVRGAARCPIGCLGRSPEGQPLHPLRLASARAFEVIP